MRIEIEKEDDGRWIAEVPDIPGVMAWTDFVFAFHDDVEIGPSMLSRIAKHT